MGDGVGEGMGAGITEGTEVAEGTEGKKTEVRKVIMAKMMVRMMVELSHT